METFVVLSEDWSSGFGIQMAEWGGFTIKLIKSPRAPADGQFMPAKVDKDGVECWSFKGNHPGYRGLAQLFVVDDEYVIVLATQRDLHHVFPVRDLPHMHQVQGEYFGGRKLGELVTLKELVASELQLSPQWSERELRMRSVVSKQVRENLRDKRQAAEAEAELKRAQRRAESEMKRASILSRQRLFVYTKAGDRRHGIPVAGDEWMCLKDGTFCVSVTSFHGVTGVVGDVCESFVVTKKNSGNPSRAHVTEVVRENPIVTISGNVAVTVRASTLRFQMVPVKGTIEEVIEVPTIEDVRNLRDRGLNSGTLVMCPKAGDLGRYKVFSLTGGEIAEVTEVMLK